MLAAMNENKDNLSLSPGTVLDSYIIDRKIGGGGFSIVYLAHLAKQPEAQVIIKEYMPRKLAYRAEDGSVHTQDEAQNDQFTHGRRLFFQEASTLATLKHPNIVNVLSFFRANGTVYMVMAYEKGINMQDYIKRHNGGLSEKLIRTVFWPLLEGLKAIHDNGLLHLDIKPGNIYLRHGGNPLLLDFGAVHEIQQSRRKQPGQVLTLGYSPVEQSTPGGYVGPWTDIYAIGATIRTCIEGVAPPPAEARRMKDEMKPAVEAFRKEGYSYSLRAAIDWAMEVDPLLRPQSVDQLMEALNSNTPEPEPDKPASMFERIADNLPWRRG